MDELSNAHPKKLLASAVIERESEAHAVGWRLEPLDDGRDGFRVAGHADAAISWTITDDGVIQVMARPGSLTRVPVSAFGPLMAGLIVRAWWAPPGSGRDAPPHHHSREPAAPHLRVPATRAGPPVGVT